MKFFHVIVALIATAVASAQSPVFTSCAGSSPGLIVTTFSVTPYPICRGKDYCITATGTLVTPITAGSGSSGSLTVSGTFMGSPIYTDVQNTCVLLASAGLPCPVAVTVTSITVCILAKANAPTNVGMVFKISATNGNGSTLFCQTTANLKIIDC